MSKQAKHSNPAAVRELLEVTREADTFTQTLYEFFTEHLSNWPDDGVIEDLLEQSQSLGSNARSAIAKAEERAE